MFSRNLCSSLFIAKNVTRSSSLLGVGAKALYSSEGPKFNVSPETLEILKATLPAVADAGTGFTKHFYARMFKAVPCLRDVFNGTNQEIGKQPAKLFNSVAVAATSVVEGKPFDQDLAELIVHKHCALGVQGPHYEVVGEHLLGTISECLTDDKAVLGAWGELYGQIATLLKETEEATYRATEAKEGGWRGEREFELFEREELGVDIARLHFRPTDGGKVCSFQSGQYTTVWAKPDGWVNRQPRHYTLLPTAVNHFGTANHYAITVRKQGLMSDHLHETDLGTRLHLSAPYGTFNFVGAEEVWLRNPTCPVVFLSAGVGLTPTFAMLESIDMVHGPILWLHGAKNGKRHPYRNRLIELANKNVITRRVWYENPEKADSENEDRNTNLKKYHFEGLMNLDDVKDLLPLGDTRPFYFFCGPPAWMDKVMADLRGYGVEESQLKCESF